MSGAASAAPVFPQCPATGLNTGCSILITINANSTVTITEDPTQGPYDGSDDSLVGIVNNSSLTISSLNLSSTTDIFGFEGDGLCTVTPMPSQCVGGTIGGGPTGYEGPGIRFTNINAAFTSGTVVFTTGLAPGASNFFALEEALTATQITAGPPTTGTPEPTTMLLFGTGLAGVAAWVSRRRKANSNEPA